MKTLVVEDDVQQQNVMKLFLSQYGDVDVAENGVVGLEKYLASCDAGTPYDLVCLDIQMPGMDGHELLKKIRDHEREAPLRESEDVKIVMTTALGDEGNTIHAYSQLCDGYLTKPINTDEFTALLEELELLD